MPEEASYVGRRKGLTIGKTRSVLYGTARLLGDVNAVRRGRVGERIAARVLGRLFGQLIRAIINAFR